MSIELTIVGDEVDSRDLLEHLVDVGQADTVEVPVLVHGEQVLEAALLHDKDRIFDCGKLIDDVWVIWLFVI